MADKRLNDPTYLKSDFAPRLFSLGQSEMMQVEVAMSVIAPAWLVELVGIGSDEATLVLVPDDGNDATGPSFVISRDLQGFRVDQVQWDAMAEVGIFRSLKEVLLALRARLAFCGGGTLAPSLALH